MKTIKPNLSESQITRWFVERNMQDLDYQRRCLLQVNESLFDKPGTPTVLAACPSAGKTSMTVAYIDFYLKANPQAKVLILTHGTNVLRRQFYESMRRTNVDFTFKVVDPENKDFDAQVIVALPTIHTSFKQLPKFDLLVVDEAHHFYFPKDKGDRDNEHDGMVPSIIARTKPTHQLLLTGTPSIFIEKRFEIITVTIEELLSVNQVTDVLVEMAISAYDFKIGDFNGSHELNSSADGPRITRENTETTMGEVLDMVLKRLTSLHREDPEKYANWRHTTKMLTGHEWNMAFRQLQKTMVGCQSVAQAKMVHQYLTDRGVDVALSTYENDLDSSQITRFETDAKCVVLIVVDRGVLGFNMPELENVIDMTLTYSPDRIFQLMGRVLRKHPKGRQKLYFKVVPTHLSNLYRGVMQIVALMSNEKYYRLYNGKNMREQLLFAELEHESARLGESGGADEKPKNGAGAKKTRKPSIPVSFADVPFFKVFIELIHRDDEALASMMYVRMGEVMDRIRMEKDYKSYDELTEMINLLHSRIAA